MNLWIVFSLLSLGAIAFVARPLLAAQNRLTPLSVALVIGIVALSSGLYYFQGSPGVQSGSGALPEMDEAIAALAQRLQSDPQDLNGWKMLGRSYMALSNYAGAADAFEHAMNLESGQNSQTLVALGEARLYATGSEVDGEISALFESALAIDPNNPQALFYGGLGAFNRDDKTLAANRWERLLSLNPPAEIEGILRQRIAEWRGEPLAEVAAAAGTAPAMANASPATPPTAASDASGAVVTARLSVSAAAAAALPADAVVFIIARDPGQPGPPIAVSRRSLAELPVTVSLGDAESMIAGRSLSGFAEFELLARVSLSGQPTQQSGDWYGSVIVRPAENDTVELQISEQVP